MQVQQEGDELIIRLSLEEAQQRGIVAGDSVEIVKVATIPPEQFLKLLDDVLAEHRGTIEYLRDK